MSDILLALGLGAGVPCVIGFAVLAMLSLRALRRDADFDAEMRAASFAFRLRMRPHVGAERLHEGDPPEL